HWSAVRARLPAQRLPLRRRAPPRSICRPATSSHQPGSRCPRAAPSPGPTTTTSPTLAWLILGLGNLLGAWWAYHVLGWGGYWGWDPVENVALMPWLAGTAFIHSIQIQERRGMLKAWNMVLIFATFFLSVFGTFVVRSGILASVHAFALSAIGPYFLTFLTLSIAGALALFFWRLPALRVEGHLDSLLSRES